MVFLSLDSPDLVQVSVGESFGLRQWDIYLSSYTKLVEGCDSGNSQRRIDPMMIAHILADNKSWPLMQWKLDPNTTNIQTSSKDSARWLLWILTPCLKYSDRQAYTTSRRRIEDLLWKDILIGTQKTTMLQGTFRR